MVLSVAERVVAQAIQEVMQQASPYKEAYRTAKARAATMATLMNGVGTFPQLVGPAANSPGQLATAV